MDARGRPATTSRNAVWKKVGIGCLAVIGIGGIACIVGIVIFVMTNPTLRNAVHESQGQLQHSLHSPVATGLGRTLCTQAVITDAEDLVRIQNKFGVRDESPPDYRWFVRCHVMDAAKAPGCQSVARAFRRLESRKGTLVVVVTAGILGHQPLCSAAWDADDRALEGAWDVNGRRVSERGAGDGPR